MRAKFINEELSNIFIPKSDEEIKKTISNLIPNGSFINFIKKSNYNIPIEFMHPKLGKFIANYHEIYNYKFSHIDENLNNYWPYINIKENIGFKANSTCIICMTLHPIYNYFSDKTSYMFDEFGNEQWWEYIKTNKDIFYFKNDDYFNKNDEKLHVAITSGDGPLEIYITCNG